MVDRRDLTQRLTSQSTSMMGGLQVLASSATLLMTRTSGLKRTRGQFKNALRPRQTWWVSRQSGSQGPCTEADISKAVREGKITSTCQLCNTAFDKSKWSETSTWPQFKNAFSCRQT